MAFACLCAPAAAQDSLDWIVAVVNGEAILNSQVAEEERMFVSRALANDQPLPPDGQMKQLMLESLIERSLQQQRARRLGVQVTSREVDRAYRRLLSQSGLGPIEFAARQGMDEAQMRRQIEFEMLVGRALQIDNRGRLDLPDVWTNELLRSNLLSEESREFLIERVSLRKGDEALAARLQRLSGDAFAEEAREGSAAVERAWISADEIPGPLFAAVRGLELGSVSEAVEHGGELHVIRLIARRPLVPGEVRVVSGRLKLLMVPAEAGRAGLDQARAAIARGDMTFEQAAEELGGSVAEMDVDADDLPVALGAGSRLRIGELSAPFRHEDGLAVALVLDVRVEEMGEGNVRRQFAASLTNVRQQELLNDWIAGLRASGTVTILREPS